MTFWQASCKVPYRNIHDIAAGALQLIQNLVLSGLGQVCVEGLRISTSLHDGSLLVLGQLAPCVIGDNSLNSARVWPSRIRLLATSGNALDL